jgi:hypothetical protein
VQRRRQTFGLGAAIVVASVGICATSSGYASAFSASPAGVFRCPASTIRVVFWANGHGELRQSAPITASMVEVYNSSGRTYRSSDLLASVSVAAAEVSSTCKQLPQDVDDGRAQMRRKNRGGASVAVQCSTGGDFFLTLLDYASSPDQIEQRGVLIGTKSRNVAYAIAGTRQPATNAFDQPLRQFDAVACKRIPPPR